MANSLKEALNVARKNMETFEYAEIEKEEPIVLKRGGIEWVWGGG